MKPKYPGNALSSLRWYRRPGGTQTSYLKLKIKNKKLKIPGNDLFSRSRGIVGPGGLNFRVRDGNGWDPSGIVTRYLFLYLFSFFPFPIFRSLTTAQLLSQDIR